MGELIAEFIGDRESVNRNITFEQTADFAFDFFAGFVAGFKDDERLWDLPFIGVVNADDRRGEDAFVRVDDGFEVRRIDIVATRDNNALEALSEVNQTVVTEIANITGVEPELAVFMNTESLSGFGVVAEVAHHH